MPARPAPDGRARHAALHPDGHPGALHRLDDQRPFTGRLDDGVALVILGDAGGYAPAPGRRAAWLALAGRCARAGQVPLLLAPLPPRLLRAESARRLRCVLLERGQPLRLARRGRGAARADDPPGQVTLPAAVDDLLAALAPGARTEPPLLRRLRLLLTDYPELAAAWAIAHREALARGALAELPPGIDLADLAWVLGKRPSALPRKFRDRPQLWERFAIATAATRKSRLQVAPTAPSGHAGGLGTSAAVH